MLSAALCNAKLIVFAINERTGKSVPIEFETEDPSVDDFAKKLLNLPEEITDLPKGFITENGISISYGGRVLEPSAILSDEGVCNEAQLYFEPQVHQMTAVVKYYPATREFLSNTQIEPELFQWTYEIPFGCSDLTREMMIQTAANCRSESALNEVNILDVAHKVSVTVNFIFRLPSTMVWSERISGETGRIIYAEDFAVHKEQDKYKKKRVEKVIHRLRKINEPGFCSSSLVIDLTMNEDVAFILDEAY